MYQSSYWKRFWLSSIWLTFDRFDELVRFFNILYESRRRIRVYECPIKFPDTGTLSREPKKAPVFRYVRQPWQKNVINVFEPIFKYEINSGETSLNFYAQKA